jgi:hypothetical protein
MSLFDWFKRKAAKRVDAPAPQQEVPAARTAVAETTRHIGYIIVKDNISLTIDGKPYSIGRSHVNFDKIVAALKAEEFEKIDGLVNVAAKLARRTKGQVTVNEFGEVLHNGKPVHNVVATRISEFVRAGLPFEPLVRFLENLLANPSERSIEQLYAFLEHGGFPITPDGCFLAYKGVSSDFRDKHTGKFDNKIGSTNEMPREKVDPSPDAACSVGFHVGTHTYAAEFASGDGKLVMVKVNPADAVSVPHDHSCEKLRVCRYEVVAMCPGKVVEPLSTIGYEGDLDLEEEDDFVEEVCYDPDEEFEDMEDWTDDGDAEADALTPVTVQAPKRAACTYCGAKGGKKHAKSCNRPKK